MTHGLDRNTRSEFKAS